MTDKQNLLAGLATTLEIEPDQILLYKATSSTFAPGYTVILTDYRKFTGVIPDYQTRRTSRHLQQSKRLQQSRSARVRRLPQNTQSPNPKQSALNQQNQRIQIIGAA
jgi:hypothetical protein